MFGMSPAIGLGLAVFAEFFACIFIIIGFKTRLAAIPMVITMAVAAFYIHGSDAWFMQATDGSSKEPAMLYLIGFASIFMLGSGKYSLDDKISSVLH
jgi:putative oxidoreductase